MDDGVSFNSDNRDHGSQMAMIQHEEMSNGYDSLDKLEYLFIRVSIWSFCRMRMKNFV